MGTSKYASVYLGVEFIHFEQPVSSLSDFNYELSAICLVLHDVSILALSVRTLDRAKDYLLKKTIIDYLIVLPRFWSFSSLTILLLTLGNVRYNDVANKCT